MTEFPSIDALASIELRQDELLRQLDELNARIERTLLQFAPRPARPITIEGVGHDRSLVTPVEMPRLADRA